jgi:hypothetical protein
MNTTTTNTDAAKAPARGAGVYKALRHALREHALATVTVTAKATGPTLVVFEGMAWLGALEIAAGGGSAKWRNVVVASPR